MSENAQEVPYVMPKFEEISKYDISQQQNKSPVKNLDTEMVTEGDRTKKPR